MTTSRRFTRPARSKAPLSFHNLAWDGDDRYIVTVIAVCAWHTERVALDKVQSIRCVQGPVQPLMNLATIHLDAACTPT